MNANKRSSADQSALRAESKNDSAAGFFLPLAFTVLAALCTVFGVVTPVVEGSTRGITVVLPLALTLLPLPVVLWFVARRRLAAAAGTMLGLAALAPGQILLDLQFLVDPSATAKPDLYLPVSLDRPGPDLGLWLLLTGHLCVVAASVMAFRLLRRRADSSDSGLSPDSDRVAAGVRGRALAVTVIAILVTIGLLLAPFTSDDVYLVALPAAQSPALILAGTLVLAVAVPLAGVLALAADFEVAQGCLIALALGLLSEALPNVIAGATMKDLGISAGPIVILVGVFFLLVIAVWPRRKKQNFGLESKQAVKEPVLPSLRRLEVITGVLGLVTALACLAGVAAPQVISTIESTAVHSPDRWWLLTAGALVAVLATGLFSARAAHWIRPVFSVAWVSVVLAGFGVLDTAVVSAEVPGVFTSASGVIWTAVAMGLAMVSACASIVTGMVEREDAEPDELVDFSSELPEAVEAKPSFASPALAALAVLAAVLAVMGFGLPAMAAPNYVGAGLFASLTTPVWGSLIALVTVVGALVIALRSRATGAAGLFAGCSLVMGLRLLELPLVGNAIEGAQISVGWWFSLACWATLMLGTLLATTQVIRSKSSFGRLQRQRRPENLPV